ncbi:MULTISPECIES: hypothetical protein [Microbacterium]|uniref:Uncharacterized protein n=1 Tax=Microbacterium oxydans TaxID=82380 RepID=A0A3Q9J5Y3_9MICO|nr:MULTISPECIES: hypothetical protein [Microbacterium]AZS39977.1 hypothetical protein CVS54_01295 [Microbacterium oxydans]KKX97185.1 hypothetical protein AAY78_14505 [Microbacterium sp. Ag1]
MAVGDDALAEGFPVVSGSELANTIDTLINETRDLLAREKRRIRVSSTQPTENLTVGTLWAQPLN